MKATKNQRLFFYVGVILFLIILGFFRDYFLRYYNLYLYQLYYNDSSYAVPESFLILKKFTYMQLYYAKYFLTVFFILIYFVITLLVVKYEFANRTFLWICFYFHAVLLLTILIFYFYGWMVNSTEKYSGISRSFLALMQSPMMLMILFPAFKLSSNLNSKTT